MSERGADIPGGAETSHGKARHADEGHNFWVSPAIDDVGREIMPGLNVARAHRCCLAMADFLDGAHADLDVTAPAAAAWRRSWSNEKLRRFLAGAIGIPDRGGHLCERLRAVALAGTTRAEFLPNRMWQELPLHDLKFGKLVVTVPILIASQLANGNPALEAVDLLAVEPVSGAVALLSGLSDGLLGHCERLEADDPVRLHRSVPAWLKSGGSTVSWLALAGIFIIDSVSPAAEELLLNLPVLCDDDEHAAELYETQQVVHRRTNLHREEFVINHHGLQCHCRAIPSLPKAYSRKHPQSAARRINALAHAAC